MTEQQGRDIVDAILYFMNDHNLSHLPENGDACLFDAGSERDVMMEHLMEQPSLHDLSEDFLYGIVRQLWEKGFDFFHGGDFA